MKSDNTTSVNGNKKQNLLNETKETLATNLTTDMLSGNVRTFSVTDMWNLRKKQQSSHLISRWLN